MAINPFRQNKLLAPVIEAAQSINPKGSTSELKEKAKGIYAQCMAMRDSFIQSIGGEISDIKLRNAAEDMIFPIVTKQIKKNGTSANVKDLVNAYAELYLMLETESPSPAQVFEDKGINEMSLYHAKIRSNFLEFTRIFDKMPKTTVVFYLNGFSNLDFINTIHYHLQQLSLEALAYYKRDDDYDFKDNLGYKSCMNTFSNLAVEITREVLNTQREALIEMKKLPTSKQNALVTRMQTKIEDNMNSLKNMNKHKELTSDDNFDFLQVSGVSLLESPSIPKGMCTALDNIIKKLRIQVAIIMPEVFMSEDERLRQVNKESKLLPSM